MEGIGCGGGPGHQCAPIHRDEPNPKTGAPNTTNASAQTNPNFFMSYWTGVALKYSPTWNVAADVARRLYL